MGRLCFGALGTALVAALLAGCGGSGNQSTATQVRTASTQTVAIPPQTTPVLPPAVDQLGAAQRPLSSQFPAAGARSLSTLARLVGGTGTLGEATGTYTIGRQRFAFALTDKANRYIYAPTAIYLAATPTSPASGPFLAPADLMGVAPQYRSAQNEGPGGLKAIYSTTIPLPKSGIFDVLALSRDGNKLIGSTGEVAVAVSTPIPGVGQRPPDVATDTLATVDGNIALLTTRQPPENMHAVSFNQVLGKRPIALLFSTPELCTSRVCGPVTDLLVSLQHEFPAISFIHQEVYVDNNPAKGLRPQLHAFHLETEPWLFTIDRQGVIVTRLQGAFGVNAARQALNAALRG